MNHKLKFNLMMVLICVAGAIVSGCGEKEPEGSPVQPAPSGSTERGGGAGPTKANTAAPE